MTGRAQGGQFPVDTPIPALEITDIAVRVAKRPEGPVPRCVAQAVASHAAPP
jgi:hypothetical protein